ncbi:ABC transporter ATP-binding protein [Specibacter sp. RAF43]|uniref:ABC transporter ATP-binding protein n=1 Tax=Specibacter sp. RAF43 TaxID=3233057 RepID=UPI003F970AA2
MNTDEVLSVSGLSVNFPGRRRRGVRAETLHAVKSVDFTISRGETLGLVGESGSGKSTVARAVMQLIPPADGRVELNGREITGLTGKKLRAARRNIQMVFQDPYSSLDPSILIADSVGEPLEVHTDLSRREREARVAELLDLVGLGAHHIERYPYEFSGGQRQRIAIARALALNPSLVICDEAVSALDVSTQNQIIALLEQLQRKLDVAYLFISHDLAVVQHISHRVAVMYFGRIVEIGPTEQIFARPQHPYTAALLNAVPTPDPVQQRNRGKTALTGEIPDIARPPKGCAFASRCNFATDQCRTDVPVFRHAGASAVACHHPLELISAT